MRLDKIKRPGGQFTFDLDRLGADGHGVWFCGPVGARWTAPHDCGVLPGDVLVLLAANRPWVAWWVADPADPRIEVDAGYPPRRTDHGWSYIDLELDVVRHQRTGVVEIEDEAEFADSCRDGWIDPAGAALGRRVATELAAALDRPDTPWIDAGWRRLRSVVGQVARGVPDGACGHGRGGQVRAAAGRQRLCRHRGGRDPARRAAGAAARTAGARRRSERHRKTVLDPATVLKPTYLPPGYSGGQAGWGEGRSAVRTYDGPGSTLTVTVGSAVRPRRAAHVVEHTTVRRHPATVYYDAGFEQDIRIAWNEDASHGASLYQTSDYEAIRH